MVRILENLEAEDKGGKKIWRCIRCGYELGPATDDYRKFVMKRDEPISKGQPKYLAPTRWDQYCIREFYCPKCGVMFEVDAVMKGEEYESVRLS